MNINTSFHLLKSFVRAPISNSIHPTLKQNAALLIEYGESLSNTIVYKSGLDVPLPDKSQVLIRVNNSSINPLDNEMRKGYARNIVNIKQNLPMILGRDCSGEIINVGSGVWDFRVGDLVWGATAPFSNGSHGEYVLLDESEISLKPKSLNHEQAASIPFAALTAWNAIYNVANISSNSRVLVNGGNGGVGFMAINLLKKDIQCKEVVATCQPKNFEKLLKAGADRVIDYTLDYNQVKDFDIVLNCVDGGETIQSKCLSTLRSSGGHYISFNGPIKFKMPTIIIKMVNQMAK
ncbi:zinc-containing alcohol dehydrogenase [Cavenderia fasciculata]|uniref:Zinc-containing alcohol dehydrogenase n=1 Tax=Cavenderia fasciculata TaxID=261658 RepID=F4Q5M2_CACFS|nr:zinc-containing alcohol dehydrogenase [Cavenderia fasciculata]EGG17281.1 zinc-containing alcohol dehydrogenase [Cavenderia fasciculata]|eukprot:XP_004355765.1 zinc-containing alcohol dehydrogenase [Cavenderia fasciculata]